MRRVVPCWCDATGSVPSGQALGQSEWSAFKLLRLRALLVCFKVEMEEE